MTTAEAKAEHDGRQEEYLNGDLTEAEEQAFLAHLAGCALCPQALERGLLLRELEAQARMERARGALGEPVAVVDRKLAADDGDLRVGPERPGRYQLELASAGLRAWVRVRLGKRAGLDVKREEGASLAVKATGARLSSSFIPLDAEPGADVAEVLKAALEWAASEDD